ncbi:MAG: hypothetical protein WD770_00525 [Actinomycetota bacterium]
MTTIRATCPRCGEVDMTPDQVFLSIRPPSSSYRFECPVCTASIEKVADRTVVALLLSAGVNLGDGRPAAPTVRPEHRELPPFTAGDLQGFRELLRDGRFLEQLLQEG